MFNYQGRLFTFGCSFTNYYWPTWADILGKQFSKHENWGLAGGGNHYIFNSIVEANKRNQFTKDDTIIVMWSGISREDKYINGQWQADTAHSVNYIKQFINGRIDERGLLIRDLAFISAAADLLELCGTNYQFLSMLPLNLISNITLIDEPDVIDLYRDTVNKIKPSMYEVIWNSKWDSRNNNGVTVNSIGNKTQVDNLVTDIIEKSYNLMKGANWPLYENYKTQNYTSNNEIAGELRNFTESLSKFQTQISWYNNLIKTTLTKNGTQRDYHPTPLEHLEYLTQIFPQLIIDPNIINWVNECNKTLLTDATRIIIEWQPNPNNPEIRL